MSCCKSPALCVGISQKKKKNQIKSRSPISVHVQSEILHIHMMSALCANEEHSEINYQSIGNNDDEGEFCASRVWYMLCSSRVAFFFCTAIIFGLSRFLCFTANCYQHKTNLCRFLPRLGRHSLILWHLDETRHNFAGFQLCLPVSKWQMT